MAGHIISIIGGKGGVGKSVFAANLAFAYAEEVKAKIMLFDFDQQAAGDLSLITGIKSKKNLKELSDFQGVIDPKTFPTFVSLQGNVSFVSMPAEKLLAESVSIEGMGKTLKTITNLYPITIIDVGSELNPLALKALEYSTLIFLVTTPDILAVSQGRRINQELITSLFPKDMVQVILNNYEKGHPVTPELVSKNLGKPIFTLINKDEKTCVDALNKSQVIMNVAKGSLYAKAVTECVRKLIQKNVLKTLEALVKPNDASSKKSTEASNSDGEKKSSHQPWIDLKSRIYKTLVDEMDMKANNDNDPRAKLILREQTKKMVVELLNKEDVKGIINSREDLNQIVKEILDEALALGPLEDLLADKECSEIMVCGPYKIFYEKSGKVKKSDITFTNDRQVLNVIERIVAPIGRRIDEKTPYVDARLANGSRVHAIIPPSAIDGCTITIRKFPENRITYKDLVKFGSMTQEMADFLRIAVEGKRNIVVSGGTGSGKTTLINVLAGFIPSNERIITCEDSAELSLPQDHIVRLETRPPSLDGQGAIDIRCLVKQTLRMRPDRILVGECRGGETLDMLQAMGTGHDGSMTTVHSNNPRECIGRLETLVQYAGTALSPKSIREMIASSVHIIVQQSRLEDGSRKVTHITELGGMQGDVVTLQDIFLFKQEGFDNKGKIKGKHQSSGFIPKFIESLERKGYNIPMGIFKN